MSWTCPGHYKVHVHGRDSPERPVHGSHYQHCPAMLIPEVTDVMHISKDGPEIAFFNFG